MVQKFDRIEINFLNPPVLKKVTIVNREGFSDWKLLFKAAASLTYTKDQKH